MMEMIIHEPALETAGSKWSGQSTIIAYKSLAFSALGEWIIFDIGQRYTL